MGLLGDTPKPTALGQMAAAGIQAILGNQGSIVLRAQYTYDICFIYFVYLLYNIVIDLLYTY